MYFTREPLIETVVTPREGYKIVVRNTKGAETEEYFVDALEIVSFGPALFFRSLERPKCFMVPVSDYEILEVRETKLVLKAAPLEKGVKIGGGREPLPKVSKEEKEEEEPFGHEPIEEVESESDSLLEAAPIVESKIEKRKERRRQRRRKGRHEEKEDINAELKPIVPFDDLSESYKNGNHDEFEEPRPVRTLIEPPPFAALIPPPSTLISDSLSLIKTQEKQESDEQSAHTSLLEEKESSFFSEESYDEKDHFQWHKESEEPFTPHQEDQE